MAIIPTHNVEIIEEEAAAAAAATGTSEETTEEGDTKAIAEITKEEPPSVPYAEPMATTSNTVHTIPFTTNNSSHDNNFPLLPPYQLPTAAMDKQYLLL